MFKAIYEQVGIRLIRVVQAFTFEDAETEIKLLPGGPYSEYTKYIVTEIELLFPNLTVYLRPSEDTGLSHLNAIRERECPPIRHSIYTYLNPGITLQMSCVVSGSPL